MTTQHPPTPYQIGYPESPLDKACGIRAIADCNKILVVQTFGGEANAEFIVRACNAHDELVEALEEAILYLDNDIPIGLHTSLQKALAKAKEEL